MKREMAMLPNGNYEEIISPIQHQCHTNDWVVNCVEHGWEIGKLKIFIEDGDPFEDGYSNKLYVNYCPFCGYSPLTKNKDVVN